VFGDKTILQPGMVLAVDDSVNVKKTFLTQLGDRFIVTGNGYEPLSEFAKDLEDVVC
jgi:Xaa-Pro aminopeptidase